jgi:hypothetical protein
MALFDLHEWLVTALAVALVAASLLLQVLPTTDRIAFADTAVCEKPGLATLGWVLILH